MTRHDVFISYNSQDKDAALSLYDQLRTQGYHPWIDVHDAMPGRRWLDQLERIIEDAPAVLVLVGGSGLGPWEAEELAAALQQAVKRKIPVVPVFLEGAPPEVDPESLPLFLRSRVAVDLRKESFERLILGLGAPRVHQRTKPSRWTVPRRNPYFTGRDDVLDALHRALDAGGRAVVGQAIASPLDPPEGTKPRVSACVAYVVGLRPPFPGFAVGSPWAVDVLGPTLRGFSHHEHSDTMWRG